MSFKPYFDIPESIYYFNTPGNGLLPRTHHLWRAQREREFFDPSGDLRDRQPDFLKQVKKAAADLFNAEESRCYLLPNFSFGFNTLLQGLPSSFKVAVLEQEYPSVGFPIISRGLNRIEIPVHPDIENSILSSIEKHRPDALAFSLVDYISGLKIDLDFIRGLKRNFPDLLILGDATQQLGTEPFNFKDSGFDAIGASGYKWMMSGFGIGIWFLSEQICEVLYREAQQGPGPKAPMWASKSILDTFFEPGHQDTLSHGPLGQSIAFFKAHGLDSIQAHTQSVSTYAYGQLSERDLLLPLIKERAVRSSLINVQVSPEHYQQLMALGIKCFPRGSGIRVGIHLYNDKADVDYLLSCLDQL